MDRVSTKDRFGFHSRPLVVLGPCVIVIALLLAYANSTRTPFVYDDIASIVENPSIRRLGSTAIFTPPLGLTVSGRPIVNASLAVNYAAGELSVLGYHVMNVTIHACTALILFGLVRRTFDLPRRPNRLAGQSSWIAFASALLWALHPLQTEAVTYVVQRAESLMGLFYLLTLYAFVRGVTAPPNTSSALGWSAVAAIACALGMATKEAMVTAPVVVLLYDRVFVAESFAVLFRRRWRVYVALSATWLILGYLVWSTGDRAGTAGLSAGVQPWRYALSQCDVLLRYAGLCLWPWPLTFDYGPFRDVPVGQYAVPSLIVVALLFFLVRSGRKAPYATFAVAAFLILLLPTSSVLPIVTEPMAEHRLYLPLAALVPLAVAGAFTIATRPTQVATIVIALSFTALCVARNIAYRSEEALWRATVCSAPTNPRAHYCLALPLLANGDTRAGETELKTALALQPRYRAARQRLAELYASLGRNAEALAEFTAVLRDYPDDFVALSNLGLLAFQRGDLTQAATHFRAAVRVRPRSAVAHNNLGGVLYERGEFSAAASHEETALTLDPTYAEAAYNLGNALARQNQTLAARQYYEKALALRSDYAEAHANLGAVLLQLRESAQAVDHFRAALRLRPDFEFAKQSLDALGVKP